MGGAGGGGQGARNSRPVAGCSGGGAERGVCRGVRSLLYLLFTIIYWAADGKDFFNNPYIYRALSWERPMSAGKLVLLILFVLCPCFNCLFWFLIWARRRVLVAAKTPSVLS